MVDLKAWLLDLLQFEHRVRMAWAGQSPEIHDLQFEGEERFVYRSKAPGGVAYTELHAPSTFNRRPLREPTDESARELAEAAPRRLLKTESFQDPRLGEVLGALVTSEHLDARDAMGGRWFVAETDKGVCVVAIERPCSHCHGMGLVGEAICSTPNWEGATCTRGWFFEGGLQLDLGERTAVERLEWPPAAHWRAVIDA